MLGSLTCVMQFAMQSPVEKMVMLVLADCDDAPHHIDHQNAQAELQKKTAC